MKNPVLLAMINDKFPMGEGNSLMLFLFISHRLSLVKFPMDVGRWLKLFSLNSIHSRFFRYPIVSGIALKRFRPNFKITSDPPKV